MAARDRQPVGDGVARWLADNAVPLHDPATVSLEDLRPLTDAFAGARVVGLGEATHGTREFFQLKHRLVEFLVVELGFTVLAMEASAAAATAVDAYVRHGIGDAADALRGLGFWIWRTHELRALLEWLHDYNRGRPGEQRVRFVGVDPQRCGPSLTRLDSLLADHAPEQTEGLLSELRELASAVPGSRVYARQRLLAAADELWRMVGTRRPHDGDALRHARIVWRAADLVTRPRRHDDPDRTAYAARARAMSDAAVELLESPSVRVALWAHNNHIAKRCPAGTPTLGSLLWDRLGDAYYATALLFGGGTFRARRRWPGPWPGRPGAVAVNRVGSGPAETIENRLAAINPDAHFLDLRAAAGAPEPTRRWLTDAHATRSFGARVTRWTYRGSTSHMRPAADYDGLAYVPVSTASRPLP